jgi:hypothetical protein
MLPDFRIWVIANGLCACDVHNPSCDTIVMLPYSQKSASMGCCRLLCGGVRRSRLCLLGLALPLLLVVLPHLLPHHPRHPRHKVC